MNYQDYQEVKQFINGMKASIEMTSSDFVKVGNDLPDTVTFLLKKGEDEYGMGGGVIPKDEIGKKIHNQIIPTIIRETQGCEILCKCETTYDKGRLSIKFTDYVSDNSEEFIHYLETQTPFRVSNNHSFMGSPICLN